MGNYRPGDLCPHDNYPPTCEICHPPNNGGWTERTFGTMEDGHEVTFRLGLGSNEGHILIADGHKSSREFRRRHNHYGPHREDNCRVEEDRGYYTGPGH